MSGTKVITLRPMTLDDVPAAAAVERLAYRQPWDAAVFCDELAEPTRSYVVADAAGELVGYAGLMVVADEAHVTTVVVHPECRGAGVGTRLMLSLVERALAGGARSLTLEVRASNSPAQRLYARFGMAPVGVRKQYYRDEDALIMWVHDIDRPEYAARLDAIRAETA